MESTNSPGVKIPEESSIAPHPSRRKFIRYAGASIVLGTLFAACNKAEKQGFPGETSGEGPGTGNTIKLGSGDTGILNFAYALEQLEAAFYTIVSAYPFFGITPLEASLLGDIRDHEIAHREFFKDALGSAAIPAITPYFNKINFTSRESVLTTAKAFEDLGVSAYNGAGSLITNPDYLTLAGKIVSVEARHAAYIRDLISYGSFADSTVINANGLDTSRTPPQVLSIAGAYIVQTIDASQLPTS